MSAIAEVSILAAMIFDSKRIPEIAAQVTADHFASPNNAKIFKAIMELHSQGKAVDAVTVSTLPGVDINSLVRLGDGPVFHLDHIKVLKEDARKRKLGLALRQAIHDLEQGEDPEIISSRFTDLEPDYHALSKVPDILNRALQEIDKNTREVLRTDIYAIDTSTGGMQLGDMWVLAARTSHGKSALALCIAEGVARNGDHVLFISAEGTEFDIACRMLARASGVENIKIRTGRLKEIEFPQVINAKAKIASLPISMLHKEHSWDRIKLLIEKQKSLDPKLKLFVLDYIGLLSAPVAEKARYMELGRITAEAKRLCEKLNLSALLVSQLNRNLDMRKDSIPRLSDLRESGNIEQDADVVTFLHCPNENEPDTLQFVIAKNRNGFTGTAWLEFDRPTLTFRED